MRSSQELEHSVAKGPSVRGVGADLQTRCVHYGSVLDVVALQFPCCLEFYSCYECHQTLADHPAQQWADGSQEIPAVLCGKCKQLMSIKEYMDCDDRCPHCGAAFNPGCKLHRHLYFDF